MFQLHEQFGRVAEPEVQLTYELLPTLSKYECDWVVKFNYSTFRAAGALLDPQICRPALMSLLVAVNKLRLLILKRGGGAFWILYCAGKMGEPSKPRTRWFSKSGRKLNKISNLTHSLFLWLINLFFILKYYNITCGTAASYILLMYFYANKKSANHRHSKNNCA